jgi:hypothetical protein
LVKKFSGCYGTQWFITMFVRACLWTLLLGRLIQPTLPEPISLRSKGSILLSTIQQRMVSVNANKLTNSCKAQERGLYERYQLATSYTLMKLRFIHQKVHYLTLYSRQYDIIRHRLTPRPTPKRENHPSSAVTIFAAIFLYAIMTT